MKWSFSLLACVMCVSCYAGDLKEYRLSSNCGEGRVVITDGFFDLCAMPETLRGSSMRNIVVIGLLTAMLAGCSFGSPDADELISLESPDRRYAVLVVRLNHHVTVPYVYKVFVLETGDTVDYSGDLDVLRVDAIDGLSVEWSGANSVDIACVVGKVYKYYNYAFIDDQNFTINLNTRCAGHAK